MLSVSSLRRMTHSTSLRVTGSLIVFCNSAAWVALPRRAAAIASLKAAMSAGEATSLAARGERAGRDVGCAAAVVPVGAPAFADALWGRGFGSGALPALEAASVTARPARMAVTNRVGV